MNNFKDTFIAYCSMIEDSSSKAHWLTLIVIIVFGFLLRFYSLYTGHAYTYFAINDEVTALNYALGFMAGDTHMLYLGSPALNQGHIPGPLWAMLVAGLYKLGGNSAEGAIFGMLLLNTVVIYLVYRLARGFMPNRYALLSCLLYSSSPWVVYYAAGLYNPIPLAFLGALLFLALWQTTQTVNSKSIFWVCLLAASIPQFHMIGVFYMPIILLLLYLSPRKINLPWFAVGAAAGLLLYLPYIIGDFQNDWQNTHAILNGEKGFSFGILKIITIPIAMLSNHPGQWAGYTFDEFKLYANQYFGSYVVLIIINLLSIVLSATFLFSLIRKSIRYLHSHSCRLKTCYQLQPEVMFIALLIFLPLILYILTGRGYSTRYSIIIFPLLFLLPALFLNTLQRSKLKKNILYALLFLLSTNIYMMTTFYKDLGSRIQSSELLMPSFRRMDDIYKEIHLYAKDRRFEINVENYISADNHYSRIAAVALAEYIDSKEQYTGSKQDEGIVKSYTLLNTEQAASTNRPVVYRDHSITIVE